MGPYRALNIFEQDRHHRHQATHTSPHPPVASSRPVPDWGPSSAAVAEPSASDRPGRPAAKSPASPGRQAPASGPWIGARLFLMVGGFTAA